jgi:hypothetical protein
MKIAVPEPCPRKRSWLKVTGPMLFPFSKVVKTPLDKPIKVTPWNKRDPMVSPVRGSRTPSKFSC